MAEDIIAKNPLDGIVVDKPEPPPVPVFTDDDLTALVGACRGKNFNDLRDAAVIRLLIDCGLRVSELTGINVEDLDLDAESVTVSGKGSRVRNAYFGSKTGLALDRYLRARRGHRHAAAPALFLGAAEANSQRYLLAASCGPSPAAEPPELVGVVRRTLAVLRTVMAVLAVGVVGVLTGRCPGLGGGATSAL